MYLHPTASLVPPPKVLHSDTKSLSCRTKTSDCRETRLSDFDTNKMNKIAFCFHIFSNKMKKLLTTAGHRFPKCMFFFS